MRSVDAVFAGKLLKLPGPQRLEPQSGGDGQAAPPEEGPPRPGSPLRAAAWSVRALVRRWSAPQASTSFLVLLLEPSTSAVCWNAAALCSGFCVIVLPPRLSWLPATCSLCAQAGLSFGLSEEALLDG